jgi:hypothetical protein
MNSPFLYSRLIEARIAEALADTPVVLVAGPRTGWGISKKQGNRYCVPD